MDQTGAIIQDQLSIDADKGKICQITKNEYCVIIFLADKLKVYTFQSESIINECEFKADSINQY